MCPWAWQNSSSFLLDITDNLSDQGLQLSASLGPNKDTPFVPTAAAMWEATESNPKKNFASLISAANSIKLVSPPRLIKLVLVSFSISYKYLISFSSGPEVKTTFNP